MLRFRASVLSLTAVATAISAGGCVKDTPAPAQRTVVANFAFPPVRPNPAVRMWPKESTSPDRKKHSVSTAPAGTSLAVKVEGGDPYLTWDLADEVALSSLRIAMRATRDGPMELFWGSAKCPVYSQNCSSLTSVPAAPSIVTFFLDPAQRARSLRVDILDAVGETVFFDSIDAFDGSDVDAPWNANAGQATAEVTTGGLVLQATGNDPSMTVGTPGLTAERITAVELLIPEAPESPDVPRLYWDSSGGGFNEASSKAVPRTDAKAVTHRVELGAADGWKGPVRALRLDPGSTPGRYVIRRITFVRGAPP